MTTRTFEALSFSTKLITNNITTFNFCNDNNFIVFFLDNKSMNLNNQELKEFLSCDFETNEFFFKTYCIENFINTIIHHN
jgi:hypothetical protein